MKNYTALIVLLLGLHLVFAQIAAGQAFPLGTWSTIDDETGEQKSHIHIFEKNGAQFGKVIKVMRESINHLCDKCEDERKNKPVLGMVIIENMTLIDGCWQGGRVLFPKEGKWYKLKYWLKPGDSDTLVVRGYLGPFFRTQYWQRVQ